MEEDIFTQIYREYFNFVYRYLYSLTFNHQKAEDLAQDVFVKAMCLLDFPDNRIKAWLLTVAHNLYVDYKKKNGRLEYSGQETIQKLQTVDMQRELDQKYKVSEVISQLKILPDTQRQAVILCLINELSYDEAAEIIGVSRSAVINLIYRARRTLRALRRPEHE